MPADDAAAEIRYRDPTQMGKVYLLPAGVDRTVPGLTDDELGPGRRRSGSHARRLAERIRRHPGELKNLLKNQAFIAGIGNAYSDEILHAARLLPFRKRSSLAPEEIDALYAATGTTLTTAIDVAPRARPADLREAGPRLPRRPRQGRQAVPPLRHADQRGQAGRLRDLVLPGLPAIVAPSRTRARKYLASAIGLSGRVRAPGGYGDLTSWPILRSDPASRLTRWSSPTVVPNVDAIPTSVSPALTR